MILLLLPFAVCFIAIYLGSGFAFNHLVNNNSALHLLINSGELNDRTEASEPSLIISTEGEVSELPQIAYESQWATMNVDGWETKDIPVYNGDQENILVSGAGQHFGSKFCGQDGKIVISAYSSTYFAELEKTPVGALVTIDTVYGKYYYRVGSIDIFPKNDSKIFRPDDGKEQLLLTTTFPRGVSYDNAEQRIVLFCDRASSSGEALNTTEEATDDAE